MHSDLKGEGVSGNDKCLIYSIGNQRCNGISLGHLPRLSFSNPSPLSWLRSLSNIFSASFGLPCATRYRGDPGITMPPKTNNSPGTILRESLE